MKVTIIGTGSLADKLFEKCYTAGVEVKIYGLRSMRISKIEEIIGSELIVFFGYDHFNVFNNIWKILTLLIFLRKKGYPGLFVYANTQGALLNKLTTNSDKVIPKGFDQYRFVKRLQSGLVRKLSKNYIDLYLPIVTGVDNQANREFAAIKLYGLDGIPDRGLNKFYISNVNSLTSFLLSIPYDARNKRVFFYTSYVAPVEFFGRKFTDCQGPHYINLTMRVRRNLRAVASTFISIIFKRSLNVNKDEITKKIALSESMKEFYSLKFINPKDCSCDALHFYKGFR